MEQTHTLRKAGRELPDGRIFFWSTPSVLLEITEEGWKEMGEPQELVMTLSTK